MRELHQLLTREEIAELKRGSDLHGALGVTVSWALIGLSLALVAAWRHPVSVVAALVVIGGRQLALAVLMHDAAHRSLFRSRWLNDQVGHWLCGAPVWTHLAAYRAHHLTHHAYTNDARDPDLGLIEPFPVSRRSLVRKLVRDIVGITGLKRMIGLLLMDFGLVTYTASVGARRTGRGRPVARVIREGAVKLGPVLLTNSILLAVLVALGHGALYLLWLGAYLTVFSLVLRIRSLAEHACTERTSDPLRNTRTTRAGWLARLTVAPHHVNYHLEHHLLMTVPHHKLPRMRRMLRARGGLPDVPTPGYVDVLRQVSTATIR